MSGRKGRNRDGDLWRTGRKKVAVHHNRICMHSKSTTVVTYTAGKDNKEQHAFTPMHAKSSLCPRDIVWCCSGAVFGHLATTQLYYLTMRWWESHRLFRRHCYTSNYDGVFAKAWFLFSGERAPLKATFVVIVNNIKQKKIGCTNQLDKPNVRFLWLCINEYR